jgi:hypothetical protein
MTDQSIEDASRRDFEKWLDSTAWKNDSLTFHNDLYQAWQAARQSSQSEPVGQVIRARVIDRVDGSQEKLGMADIDWSLVKDGDLLYAAPQQAIPSGWKLVPIEITYEMRQAAYEVDEHDIPPSLVTGEQRLKAVWKAILSASPTAPIESDK